MNLRRLITLLVLIAIAWLAIRLIDGRVMRTMARYADQPRQIPSGNASGGGGDGMAQPGGSR